MPHAPHAAHVASIEAIEDFRAALLVYISKARPTLDEIGAETLRVRQWVEVDRRTYWEAQLRRRTKELETARQELFSATMANLRDTASAEMIAVRRAERAFHEAEDKLIGIKKWARDFDSRALPLARQLQKLETLLSNDLPAAAIFLAQTIRALDAYAAVSPLAPADAAAPASGSAPAEPAPPPAPTTDTP